MTNSPEAHKKDWEEKELVQKIANSRSSEDIVSTTLKTDERVIARVTDGIYRQPASALRELINNAYDADATRVVVKTDWPRFDKIYVEDNGLGMSIESLAHMLMHIGGSAKRQEKGQNLGVASSQDVNSSPSGRKLIGKIGIGLFSVSQLTQKFQIITKRKGDNYRLIATVALKQYSDEIDDTKNESEEEFESGKVNIWREAASDIEAHGTTIILTSIKSQAKNTLRSYETWAAIDQEAGFEEAGSLEPPKYHIGRVDITGELLEKYDNKFSNLPWSSGDEPKHAFQKIVNCVWAEFGHTTSPDIDKLFDYYLQMVWLLGLSIPTTYVDGHLFDMDLNGWSSAYKIANEVKGAAQSVNLEERKPIREILSLKEGLTSDSFDVFFDDIQLFRPIKFKQLPFSPTNALKKPFIFFGSCVEKFENIPTAISGGPLAFEAYLFWNSKIAPRQHRGSLIRIKGASGTLFDPTFMRYQVAELTRLSQITCEIFIQRGFDSALNIDRESFNYAHPHAVFLTKWLHSALRQLATTLKKESNAERASSKIVQEQSTLNAIQQVAVEAWQTEVDEDSLPPSVTIESDATLFPNAEIVIKRETLSGKDQHKENVKKKTNSIIDEKLKAILQLLATYRLLDDLSSSKREKLAKSIYKILETN